jgi:hypothetical protein
MVKNTVRCLSNEKMHYHWIVFSKECLRQSSEFSKQINTFFGQLDVFESPIIPFTLPRAEHVDSESECLALLHLRAWALERSNTEAAENVLRMNREGFRKLVVTCLNKHFSSGEMCADLPTQAGCDGPELTDPPISMAKSLYDKARLGGRLHSLIIAMMEHEGKGAAVQEFLDHNIPRLAPW